MPDFDFIHRTEWIGPTHEELPYAFKLDMIDLAKSMGYKTIVWLDSSVVVHGYPQEALDHAEKWGVATWENPNDLEKFTNDSTIKAFNIKSFRGMKQVMAGCQVWNLENDHGCLALIEWYLNRHLFAEDQTEREGFVAHRHDQTILSIVLHEIGIPILDYGGMAYPDHITDKTYFVPT